MSVSQIDSLISELGSDKAMSNYDGRIQRKPDQKLFLAQTPYFLQNVAGRKKYCLDTAW